MAPTLFSYSFTQGQGRALRRCHSTISVHHLITLSISSCGRTGGQCWLRWKPQGPRSHVAVLQNLGLESSALILGLVSPFSVTWYLCHQPLWKCPFPLSYNYWVQMQPSLTHWSCTPQSSSCTGDEMSPVSAQGCPMGVVTSFSANSACWIGNKQIWLVAGATCNC